METLVTLSPVELERMLIAIESSLQVHRRPQYFLWTQGILQSFLAHDALIFGHGPYASPEFSWETLARGDSREEQARQQELNKLVLALVNKWQRGGHVPCLCRADADGDDEIGKRLARLGLGHALAHGAREFTDDSSGFFVFLRMPEPPGKRQAYFAQILMPYLHTALHRMLQAEQDTPKQRMLGETRLSSREIEVISLVRDGKTNKQIAEALRLSTPTVKNHMQNVLRKLDVSNRAQAVAKAVQVRLISD
jgi:transcriptional regulator EpsA